MKIGEQCSCGATFDAQSYSSDEDGQNPFTADAAVALYKEWLDRHEKVCPERVEEPDEDESAPPFTGVPG